MPQRTQDEGIELLHPAFSEYTSNGIPLVSLSMETCWRFFVHLRRPFTTSNETSMISVIHHNKACNCFSRQLCSWSKRIFLKRSACHLTRLTCRFTNLNYMPSCKLAWDLTFKTPLFSFGMWSCFHHAIHTEKKKQLCNWTHCVGAAVSFHSLPSGFTCFTVRVRSPYYIFSSR